MRVPSRESGNPGHRLPPHIVQALNEGRYRPGRGPWYCNRVLPSAVPLRRCDLIAAGVSRRTVERDFVTVAKGIVVAAAAVDPPESAASTTNSISARNRGAYPTCGVLRARAFHLVYPDHVIAGWQAAAVHGLPYWADSAPLLLLSRTGAPSGSDRTTLAALHPLQVAVRPWPSGFDGAGDAVHPDPLCPSMAVVSETMALVQCLRSVFSGKHGWKVAPVPGLGDRFVRAIQLVDAFALCTTISWMKVEEMAVGTVSRREMLKLRSMVALGAESPRETELRLIVRDLLPRGLRWETQVAVEYSDIESNGVHTVRTTFLDLGCRVLRIGLYYDGAYHRSRHRTERDFAQLQDLRNEQWIIVRVNRDLLANQRKLVAQVATAITQALQH